MTKQDKIEIGRVYRARCGALVEIVKRYENQTFPIRGRVIGDAAGQIVMLRDNGTGGRRKHDSDPYDLMAEAIP